MTILLMIELSSYLYYHSVVLILRSDLACLFYSHDNHKSLWFRFLVTATDMFSGFLLAHRFQVRLDF